MTAMPHTTGYKQLPFVSSLEPHKLPHKPGLYYVVRGDKLLYVGLAGEKKSTLYHRWNSYAPHKMVQFASPETRIHYKVYTDKARKRLRYDEALEIRKYLPPYNVQRPDPKLYKLGWDCDRWMFLAYLLLSTIFLWKVLFS